MSSTDQKLDQILEKLNDIEKVLGAAGNIPGGAALKREFVEYMLKHFNISWIDDSIEEDAYSALFDIAAQLLSKAALSAAFQH